jgi:hypothetical protein
MATAKKLGVLLGSGYPFSVFPSVTAPTKHHERPDPD